MHLPTIDPGRDPAGMSDEEFSAWLAEPVPDPPPPSAWPLNCNEGRCGFLESYIWRGEVALFESVTHIWNQLNEPKGARAIAIGLAAGSGGSGKWALAKFLRKALREALAYDEPPPWTRKWNSLESLHEAAMAHFQADYDHYERAVQKYADILNGTPGRHQPISAEVIIGPWAALQDKRPAESRSTYESLPSSFGRETERA